MLPSTGVGDVLPKLALLARGGEHGAEYLVWH